VASEGVGAREASAGAPGAPEALPDFSLVEGGPFYRAAVALGLVRTALGLLGPGAVLAVVTWVPLLVLSAIEGVAADGNVTVPFLKSVSAHARFLVAIPLLFAAEAWVDPRLRHVIQQIVGSGLIRPADRPAFATAVRTTTTLRDSVLVEVAILGLVVGLGVAGVRVDLAGEISTWRTVGAGPGAPLTLAGWWYTAVGLPIFQFLLGRWCWRLLVWWVLLWRLSRLDLQLIPTHPDLAGGLGHLGVAQSHFGTVSFAASAVWAAAFAEDIHFGGTDLQALRLPVLGIVLLNLALFVAPLMLFGPQLLAVKRRGLREYGVLAAGYTRAFDAKWIRGGGPPDEPILGTGDLQSLADLASSFEIIRRMRVVPFGWALVVSIVAATLAPMLPLLLLAFPLDELILKLLKLLLGA
jgi:hypothetical protein